VRRSRELHHFCRRLIVTRRLLAVPVFRAIGAGLVLTFEVRDHVNHLGAFRELRILRSVARCFGVHSGGFGGFHFDGRLLFGR
jgi:hypothetical protein